MCLVVVVFSDVLLSKMSIAVCGVLENGIVEKECEAIKFVIFVM